MSEGREFWEGSVALSASAQKYYGAGGITSPYEGSPLELTVFVSCYNEDKYIINTLETITEAMRIVDGKYEIIVVDDASKDRSVELLRRYVADHPEHILVLRANKRNKGLAANYIDASFIGRGKYICLVRGDNTESVQTLCDLFKSLGEADILIPYDVSTQQRQDRPRAYIFYNRLFNMVTRQRISEYNGLSVHLRYNVMRWHPSIYGYGFQACLLSRLLDLGFTFKQVPCRTAAPRGEIYLTWIKTLSVLHAMADIMVGRISRRIYKR